MCRAGAGFRVSSGFTATDLRSCGIGDLKRQYGGAADALDVGNVQLHLGG